MSRADPHGALVRALLRLYPDLCIAHAHTEAWASVTFTGMRHILRCVPIEVAGLENAEFALPGHLVADLTVDREVDALVIEALTIETS